MILKGKYTNASVFAETIDSETLSQIREIINQSFMENSNVAIMPDAHAGAGVCIGFTASLNGKVVPNFVGVDIGCGVTSQYIEGDVDFKTLDSVIRYKVPNGKNNNESYSESEIQQVIEQMDKVPENLLYRIGLIAMKVYENKDGDEKVYRQLGSLGGGNHFIAVNETTVGERWLTVHSGSRNFGLTVAKYHQNIAKEKCEHPEYFEKQIKRIIRETPEREIEKKLIEFKASLPKSPPAGMEYLEGVNAANYFDDMEMAQWFARINRRMIINRILKAMNFKLPKHDFSFVETVHNYIDFEDQIMRKGAVRAHKDEYLLIPLSMKDGVLFCKGKGNPDWNKSAPHGAGRLMSRKQAKETLAVEEYKRQMAEAGVWSTCIGQGTLDESPMAYKNSSEIKRVIGDTVEIVDHWKEVYNFKAKE
jgi:RNA-splicing ligase RtcB